VTVTTTVHRTWEWGVAFLSIPGAEVPEVGREQLVAVGGDAAAIRVRHRDDFDLERGDDFPDRAPAVVHVTTRSESLIPLRPVVADFVIACGERKIELGDATESRPFSAPAVRTRVVISCEAVDLTGLDEVWIDLAPA
jgi:hypothetical protein